MDGVDGAAMDEDALDFLDGAAFERNSPLSMPPLPAVLSTKRRARPLDAGQPITKKAALAEKKRNGVHGNSGQGAATSGRRGRASREN